MLNILPDLLRNLISLPQIYRYRPPVKYPGEWPLYALAARLGIDFKLAYRLMDAGPLPPRFRYRHFAVPKKDGSRREIVEPGTDLKAVQRRILKLFLEKRRPHPSALGFRRKTSIAHHAWAHAGAAIIITGDIEDFFPSTTRQRVKAWWHAQNYSTLEVRLLTSLTTYLGALPQGAPTSPALSNLVNSEMDSSLERRLRASGGTYTRYGDDLAFSWPEYASPPADFEQAVRSILRQYGYRLHPAKGWHVWNRRDEPEITGLILKRSGGVDIPKSMQRIMHVLGRSSDPDDAQRLAGYRGYRSMVVHRPEKQTESVRRRPHLGKVRNPKR